MNADEGSDQIRLLTQLETSVGALNRGFYARSIGTKIARAGPLYRHIIYLLKKVPVDSAWSTCVADQSPGLVYTIEGITWLMTS